jgi:hypothetical protein
MLGFLYDGYNYLHAMLTALLSPENSDPSALEGMDRP